MRAEAVEAGKDATWQSEDLPPQDPHCTLYTEATETRSLLALLLLWHSTFGVCQSLFHRPILDDVLHHARGR